MLLSARIKARLWSARSEGYNLKARLARAKLAPGDTYWASMADVAERFRQHYYRQMVKESNRCAT